MLTIPDSLCDIMDIKVWTPIEEAYVAIWDRAE